jgi:hypothetical protein
MYRIKVTGYVQYHEGEDPDTSLQNRAYGTLQIRAGYRFNILVVRDLTFERPYVVPSY